MVKKYNNKEYLKTPYQLGRLFKDPETVEGIALNNFLDLKEIVSVEYEQSEANIKDLKNEYDKELADAKEKEKSLSLGISGISEALSLLSFKWADLIIWFMLGGEFILGFYLLRAFFADDTISHFLSAAIIASIVVFLGYILKKSLKYMPKFMFHVYFIVCITAGAFTIYNLAEMRETETFSEYSKSLNENLLQKRELQEKESLFFFNLGLLTLLLFGAAVAGAMIRDPYEEKEADQLVLIYQVSRNLDDKIKKVSINLIKQRADFQNLSKKSNNNIIDEALNSYLSGAQSFWTLFSLSSARNKEKKILLAKNLKINNRQGS